MKSLYDIFMRPLEKRGISERRKELLQSIEGRVLEIGSGTGVNLQYYDLDNIDLTLSDVEWNKHLKQKMKDNVKFVKTNVESLPFQEQEFDCVVHTLVFCSVHDVSKGLLEISRVLKDDGKLIFIEHVIPKKNPLRRIFKILTPFWKHIASNCHLDRDYIKTLETHGFTVEKMGDFGRSIFVYGIAFKGLKG